MTGDPIIAVVSGGISKERTVSLGSGHAVFSAMSEICRTELIELRATNLPSELDPRRHLVFSTLHGTFGEDGGFQKLLESNGIEYAGCDSESSRLTFDKSAAKNALKKAGVPVLPEIVFDRENPPDSAEAFKALDGPLVLKPLERREQPWS